MPLLSQLRSAHTRTATSHVASLAALTRTRRFRTIRDESLRALASWREQCATPALSCSGGKDSAALLLLARQVDPALPIYRADPPNGLPDREGYITDLVRATSSHDWRAVPYPWDVEAVLRGDLPYPAMLKIRRLDAAMRTDGIDGMAMGLRAEESRQRRLSLRRRGLVYRHQTSGRLVCCPLGWWTAEEVVGFLLSSEDLPLNPVYTKLELAPPLNYLRDGTWYPREIADATGYRSWLARHYPEVVAPYDRAVSVGALWQQAGGMLRAAPSR